MTKIREVVTLDAVMDAIQAAALANNYTLADEIAKRHELNVCRRCACSAFKTAPLFKQGVQIADEFHLEYIGWVCFPCARTFDKHKATGSVIVV
jgi:hypothetical protein